MSRARIALDRVVLLLLGLAVLLAGVATVVWGLEQWPDAPAEIDLGVVRAAPEHPWWLWVLGVGGVTLVVLGLNSLVSHARRRRVRHVSLPPGDGRGRARLDLPALAAAAADALARSPHVDSVDDRVLVDRGTTVIELTARTDASVDLPRLREAISLTRDQLAASLPAGVCHIRVRLDARRHRVERPRVT